MPLRGGASPKEGPQNDTTMKKLILLLLWLPALRGHAQPAGGQSAPEAVFADGEYLEYAISYKVSLVNTDVAGVTFRTAQGRRGDRDVYTVDALGKGYPFYRWFFDLNDSYVSTLDAGTLRPLELKAELREGKYRYSSRYEYDWDEGVVRTTFRNHKNPDSSRRQMPLREGSFDALALFFNLRCADLSELERNGSGTMDLVLEDTIRTIRYRLMGRENKNIRGTGKFRTLKFRCQLATSSGESFEDGSEFTIWISDDRNRIPLYIESPIRVGSIRGRLIEWKNLKYPLDSKMN